MGYEKKVFQKGDIVTSSQLNKMQTQIAQNESNLSSLTNKDKNNSYINKVWTATSTGAEWKAASGGGGQIIQDPTDSKGGIITSGTSASVDKSLTLEDYAADAKVTGDAITSIIGTHSSKTYEDIIGLPKIQGSITVGTTAVESYWSNIKATFQHVHFAVNQGGKLQVALNNSNTKNLVIYFLSSYSTPVDQTVANQVADNGRVTIYPGEKKVISVPKGATEVVIMVTWSGVSLIFDNLSYDYVQTSGAINKAIFNQMAELYRILVNASVINSSKVPPPYYQFL